MTRDRSASLKVVRIAAVCCASTSRWAIFWRMPLIRWRVSRGRAREGGATTADAGLGVGCGGVGVGAAGARSGAAGVARWARTSPLVIRPLRPVPSILVGSRCSSATKRRTAGERSVPAPPFDCAAVGWGSAGAPRAPTAAGASCRAASTLAGTTGGAEANGWPSGSIVPTVVPIDTVVPSPMATFRTPDVGAGITLLALSVSSSNSGSPALTAAPSGLSQRDRIPSVIDSPTPGTVIATAGMMGSSPCL